MHLPCRLPLRTLLIPPHRRKGASGRAAGHRGPHYSEEPEQRKAVAAVIFVMYATCLAQMPFSLQMGSRAASPL